VSLYVSGVLCLQVVLIYLQFLLLSVVWLHVVLAADDDGDAPTAGSSTRSAASVWVPSSYNVDAV
jgi:hypothetical protein